MEYIIGKIYMDTRVAYSSSRYMYLGNDLLFRFMNPEEWHGLDAYILCSYTYGPLLGLFAFGLFTRRRVADRWVPFIAVCSPLLCYATDWAAQRWAGYHFGYELLMLNGLITFAGLYLSGLSDDESKDLENSLG